MQYTAYRNDLVQGSATVLSLAWRRRADHGHVD